MPKVDEGKVLSALLTLRASGTAIIDGQEIGIKIDPVDNHAGDSPDFLLWLEVGLHAFGQALKVRVPIPVEAEKGGIDGGAMEDLSKFVERRRHRVQLPMLVVAEAGYDVRKDSRDLPAELTIIQVPIRALED